MATNFPTSLDNLSNPEGSDPVNNPSHAVQHANVNDAIEALETKVGVNNSAVTTSLDYRVKQLETNPTYTNEMAQDAVAAALAAGTHTNITINYNDTGNSISISAAAGYTNEEAVDAVAAALTAGSGISISYNDPANTITISLDSTIATKTYVDTAITSLGNTAATTYVPQSDVGNIDGVASLDGTGKVPDSQIPAGIARDSEVTSAISTEVTNRNSAISTAINNLINSAPGTLDTLGEIATQLAADESAAAALTTVVNGKVSKAGGDIIQPSSASTVPLRIKGAASQSADLLQWLNSSGDLLGRFHPTAGLLISGVSNTGGGAAPFMVFDSTNFSLYTNTASNKGLIIKGAASQTANLQEWQNSSSAILARITSTGVIGTTQNVYASRYYYSSNGTETGTSISFIDGAYSGGLNIRNIDLSTPNATYDNVVPLSVSGNLNQTADLQRWTNSSGTVLSKIDSGGSLNLATGKQVIFNNGLGRRINFGYDGNYGLGIDDYTVAIEVYNGTDIGRLAVRPSTATYASSYVNPVEIYANGQIKQNLTVASNVGLSIKGAASQTANLQEWQNSAGAALAYVTSDGSMYAGNRVVAPGDFEARSRSFFGYPSFNLATLNINTASTTQIGAVIRGQASQTANLQEWQNSASGVLLGIDSTGSLNIGSGSNNIWRIKNQTSTVVEWQPVQGFMFLPYGSSNRPVTIKGAASQTANLTEWQNNNGDALVFITPNGILSVGDRLISYNGVSTYNASTFGAPNLLAPFTYDSIVNISTVYSTSPGLVIRGVALQTADLQQWRNSAGTVLAKVDKDGNFNNQSSYGSIFTTSVAATGGNITTTYGLYSNLPASTNAGIAVQPWGADIRGALVKGFAAQTANLQEWQNSSGTVLSKVDSSGAMFTITPADSTNSTQVATTAYVKSNIANLISSAPATLDTLNELATALGNDANFSTTVTNSIALKAPLASPTFTGTVSGITKTMVGLGSVDNTADIAKPISTATQTALDLKAALVSPTFTGTPLAPTATTGTNTTQIATTAFVKTAIDTSVQPGAVYQTSAPSSPAVGQIWIDSDEDVTTFDSNIIRRKAITATAGQTVFTADLPFIDGFEQIFMNGLLLVKTTDYATSGGNTVTLTSGAAASDVIEIVSVTGANSVTTYTQAEVDTLIANNKAVSPQAISANTTLVKKKRYYVTSASALTLTLPASPTLDDEIQIVDASGNASTYNITVARNGSLINGGTGNLIIDTNGGWYTLIYTGSTYGWKVG